MKIKARICHLGQIAAKLFTPPHPKCNTQEVVSVFARITNIDLQVPELELACWKFCDSDTLLLVSACQLMKLTIKLTADMSKT
jgi:hypothetical protein